MKMVLFTAIAIIIVTIIIIIIVVIIVVLIANQNQGTSNNNNPCQTQNDCSLGYVCVRNNNTNTNICKAGLGIPCNTDDDCATNLICLGTGPSGNKVCLPKLSPESIINNKNKVSRLFFDRTQQNKKTDSIKLQNALSDPVKIENNASKLSGSYTPITFSPKEIQNTSSDLIKVENNTSRLSAPYTPITPITPSDPTKISGSHIPVTASDPIETQDKFRTFGSHIPVTSSNPIEIQNKPKAFGSHIPVTPSDPIEIQNKFRGSGPCTPLSSDIIEQTSMMLQDPAISRLSNEMKGNPISPPNKIFESPMQQGRHTNNISRNPTKRGIIKKVTNNMSGTPTQRGIIKKVTNNNQTGNTSQVIIHNDVITPFSDNIEPSNGIQFKSLNNEVINPFSDNINQIQPKNSELSDNNDIISRMQPQIETSILQEMKNRNYNPITESTLDDEINSDGTHIDAPFDVRSAETLQDDPGYSSVSTPCEEREGVYYCRSNKVEMIQGSIGHSPVIDVCSYSNATIFLLEDGNIICEMDQNEKNKRRYRASNNVRLIRITSFNGYLYGVGFDQRLYTLPNNLFPTTIWLWNLVDWSPTNIKTISSTYDTSYLWIQTDSMGYLYNAPGVIKSQSTISGFKRVYGRDVNHYIDIDINKYIATVHPGNVLVNNVYDGVLSYYDEVIAIHPSEQNEYHGITIVNWRPYYIRA